MVEVTTKKGEKRKQLQTVKTDATGILKCDGENIYHAYISDNLKHDQTFVKVVIDNMLDTTDTTDNKVIVIESDNCSAQYKSAKHFYDLQDFVK